MSTCSPYLPGVLTRQYVVLVAGGHDHCSQQMGCAIQREYNQELNSIWPGREGAEVKAEGGMEKASNYGKRFASKQRVSKMAE